MFLDFARNVLYLDRLMSGLVELSGTGIISCLSVVKLRPRQYVFIVLMFKCIKLQMSRRLNGLTSAFRLN